MLRTPVLWLALRSRLPLDVVAAVAEIDQRHRCAVAVQRVVRGGLCRRRHAHRCHPLWRELERELEACVPGVVSTLTLYPAVRLEWRTDPSAWLYTLRRAHADRVVRQILLECLAGMW